MDFPPKEKRFPPSAARLPAGCASAGQIRSLRFLRGVFASILRIARRISALDRRGTRLALKELVIWAPLEREQDRSAEGQNGMGYATMDWRLDWGFWRRGGERRDRSGMADADSGSCSVDDPTPVDWEEGLIDAGVSPDWAPRLATRLEGLDTEFGPESRNALLRATAEAVDVQSEVQADVERNLRDVREVERLLGAFTGELEKLDEVLGVLGAYAQRMRSQPVKRVRETLH